MIVKSFAPPVSGSILHGLAATENPRVVSNCLSTPIDPPEDDFSPLIQDSRTLHQRRQSRTSPNSIADASDEEGTVDASIVNSSGALTTGL